MERVETKWRGKCVKEQQTKFLQVIPCHIGDLSKVISALRNKITC